MVLTPVDYYAIIYSKDARMIDPVFEAVTSPMFNSSRVNNERDYNNNFRAHSRVIREHICKLYVLAYAPTSTPRSWCRSIYHSALSMRVLYWGKSGSRIRWGADKMEDALLDEGLEDAQTIAGWFESCQRSTDGYETAYEDNPKAVDRLAELAFPNIKGFAHDLCVSISGGGKDIRRDLINAAINGHFSPEMCKVLPPEEAEKLRVPDHHMET